MFLSAFIQWLEANLLTCPVKSYTGIDCPGCGLQRSWLLLLKGDIAASIAMHPAGIPILFLLAYAPLHLRFDFRFGAKIITVTYLIIAVLTLVHYVYKLSSGHAFH